LMMMMARFDNVAAFRPTAETSLPITKVDSILV